MDRVWIWVTATVLLVVLLAGERIHSKITTDREADRVTTDLTCAMGGDCD